MALEDANISELLEGFFERQREDNEKTLAQFRQEIEELLRNHDLSESARKSIEALADSLKIVEVKLDLYGKWLLTNAGLIALLFAKVYDGDADAIEDVLSEGSDPQLKSFKEALVGSLRRRAASSSARQ